jgi:hypothetical protein
MVNPPLRPSLLRNMINEDFLTLLHHKHESPASDEHSPLYAIKSVNDVIYLNNSVTGKRTNGVNFAGCQYRHN